MFRLSVESFCDLVDSLDLALARDEAKAEASSGIVLYYSSINFISFFLLLIVGGSVSTTVRLAVTLRWLAGASYLDLCFAWGISRSFFYSSRGAVWPTIEAIDAHFSLGLNLHNRDQLQQLSDGFTAHSGGIMSGCVAAIDGLIIKTRAPTTTEVKAPKHYRSRKGGFGVLVLAGCDVKGKFVFAAPNYSASTHDSPAWEATSLYNEITANVLPPEFFLIGDEAFSNTNQMLSPWPGRGLGRYKDSFNYWLSHSRQCVERGFGMLIMRWGIFWRKLTCDYERWSLIITACIKLHNYCIDRGDSVPKSRHVEDYQTGDYGQAYDNADPLEDDTLRRRAIGDRRNYITNELERLGKGRPPHAACNSRA